MNPKTSLLTCPGTITHTHHQYHPHLSRKKYITHRNRKPRYILIRKLAPFSRLAQHAREAAQTRAADYADAGLLEGRRELGEEEVEGGFGLGVGGGHFCCRYGI